MKEYKRRLATICLLVSCVVCCSVMAAAQEKRAESVYGVCESGWLSWERGGRKVSRYRECRTEELRLPAPTGKLIVDGRQNGSITVTGWDRREMLVRARIELLSDNIEEARRIVSQVTIETGDNRIRAASLIDIEDKQIFSVSYEIFLPRESDLALTTFNGGIGIKDMRGQTEFKALNGGVTLTDLAGDVRGETTNGGLTVRLAGATWDGSGLDARTTNGGVTVEVPEGFQARLVTGTTAGSVKNELANTARGGGGWNENQSVTLNPEASGAFVRLVTINGGVRIKHRSVS